MSHLLETVAAVVAAAASEFNYHWHLLCYCCQLLIHLANLSWAPSQWHRETPDTFFDIYLYGCTDPSTSTWRQSVLQRLPEIYEAIYLLHRWSRSDLIRTFTRSDLAILYPPTTSFFAKWLYTTHSGRWSDFPTRSPSEYRIPQFPSVLISNSSSN